MPQAHLVVVGVVGRGDLDHAGAEGLVHVVVGDHRHQAAGDGQAHLLADQVGVALVFRVHHHRGVAQHRLGPGGGHHQRFGAALDRVADVPQVAFFLFAFHLQVGDGALEDRVPAHQPLAAVDQAFFVQAHEGLGDHLGELVVHGEVLMVPAHAVAHAAHLLRDGGAGLLLPLPHTRDEILAAQVVAALALVLQLALHHDLRGDAGMVGAGHPQRVEAAHAVVARQRVHDGLVERMAHVQRARHVGRRQLDAEAGLGRIQRGLIDAALLPQRPPVGLDRGGFEGLGEFGHGRKVRCAGPRWRAGARALQGMTDCRRGYISRCSPALSPPRMT